MPNAYYFGDLSGTWDVAYEDGSVVTIVVDEDGGVTVNSPTSPVDGELQLSSGNESMIGWRFHLVGHNTDDQYLMKIVNGSLSVSFSSASKTVQGTGSLQRHSDGEADSLPMVPIFIGAGVALVGISVVVFLCVLRRCRRSNALKEASPSSDAQTAGNDEPDHRPATLLGAKRVSSKDVLNADSKDVLKADSKDSVSAKSCLYLALEGERASAVAESSLSEGQDLETTRSIPIAGGLAVFDHFPPASGDNCATPAGSVGVDGIDVCIDEVETDEATSHTLNTEPSHAAPRARYQVQI